MSAFHRVMFLLVVASVTGTAMADTLSARDIMQRATQAAGGDAWRRASSLHLTGHAVFYRDGIAERAATADRYEMWRDLPVTLEQAHATTGRFRLDAHQGERLLFRMSFDGERMYDQRGPVAAADAEVRAAESFGFSAVRFALGENFQLQRMADDQVEGHPCYFVQITDPSGAKTLIAVDQEDFSIRQAAWDTPKGWHQRIYSDFYRLEPSQFQQAGRVRLYYRGVKTTDIRWTRAEINVPLSDPLFAPAPEPPTAPAPTR